MTPEMQAMGIGAVITVAVSILAALKRDFNQHVDAMACAVILGCLWIYGYLMDANQPPPAPAPVSPANALADGMAAAIVLWLFFTRPRIWKAMLAGALIVSVGIELSYAIYGLVHSGVYPGGVRSLNSWLSNIAYWAGLLAVSGGAMIDGQAVAFVRNLLRRPHRAGLAHRSTLDTP